MQSGVQNPSEPNPAPNPAPEAAPAATVPAAAPAAAKPVVAKKAAAKKTAARKAPVEKAVTAKSVQPAKAVKPETPAAKAAKTVAPSKTAKAVKAVGAAKPTKPTKPTKAGKPVVAAEAPRPVKVKLVRDSFTMPGDDYALLAALKQRALKAAHPAKKSEVLRAGLRVLAGLTDAALLAALKAVPSIKTGRPKGKKPE